MIHRQNRPALNHSVPCVQGWGCGYAYDCLLFVPVTAMYVEPGAWPYSKSHYVSPSCVLFLQSVTFF